MEGNFLLFHVIGLSFSTLPNHLDGAKGDGTFQRLTDALEKKDYETASKVMDKKQN
jgi:hypothetical protein